MKKLIIAEKPSLAREIQQMLEKSFAEKFENKGEYYESQNYYLSSFFGHLLQMAKPQSYDEKYQKWILTDLPIIPENFIFEYKDSTKKRGKLLKDLSDKSSSIINATDPDREGEGIFRTWYKYERIKKQFERFWATSLTLADLTKAWKNLKSSNQFDTLALAQEARAKADWLVGMNASRLYSILTGDRCPVGRVKTATLSIIVKRDYEVENYKESYHYTLTGIWKNFNVLFINENQTKFDDKSLLDQFINKIQHDNFKCLSFKKEEKKQYPPKTYSQPDLQKDADNKFGFSLDKTLEITQNLYEKKLVTYPRTDSSYLPESDLKNYYDLINKIATEDQKKLLLPGTKPFCVKDTESPHTAIVPTYELPVQLTNDEQKIYNLIVERFITAFMNPKIYDQYILEITNGNKKFRSIFNIVKDKGFKALYDIENEEKEEIEELTDINEQDIKSSISKIDGLKVNAIKKTKPKYYTPATLLTAMMNAGKNIMDNESREIMNEVEGLGTAATRQLYPVELEKDGFIIKKGGNLISSTKGRKLIELITSDLKSVEKTAELEKKLRLIETGTYNLIEFQKEIHEYVRGFLSQAKGEKEKIEFSFGAIRPCPKCSGTLERLKCNKCDFVLYTKIAGKILDQKYIDQLFNDKKTETIKGFEGKKGKFEAKLMFDENYKVVFDFEKDSIGNCKCGGKVIESQKAFNCASCKKTVWKEVSGNKITIKQAVSLLHGQKVNVKGLKSKAGKDFDAILYLDNEGKIKFEFSK